MASTINWLNTSSPMADILGANEMCLIRIMLKIVVITLIITSFSASASEVEVTPHLNKEVNKDNEPEADDWDEIIADELNIDGGWKITSADLKAPPDTEFKAFGDGTFVDFTPPS